METFALTDAQGMVQDFMEMAGQATPETPTWPEYEVRWLRRNLCEEECEELGRALHPPTGDLAYTVKEICDLLYVTLGTACALGVDIAPLFAIVHADNMQKREKGTGGGTQKFQKPEGWLGPGEAIKAELLRQGWSG